MDKHMNLIEDKDRLIIANENDYKSEVIDKWGSESYDSSKQKIENMSEREFNHFNELNIQIIDTLLQIDQTNEDKLRKKVANLHKEWISMAWGSYNKEMHIGLVEMYLQDERFKKYYDKHKEGLALILRDSVRDYI